MVVNFSIVVYQEPGSFDHYVQVGLPREEHASSQTSPVYEGKQHMKARLSALVFGKADRNGMFKCISVCEGFHLHHASAIHSPN